MRISHLVLTLLLSSPTLMAQEGSLQGSRCFAFIDYQFVWTLELVQPPGGGASIPVLNIVTFVEGQWDLRPDQLHLINDRGREAEIKRMSIDTGVPGEPYIVQYLKVQGDSFIGLDLVGEFEGFDQLTEVSIDLGESRFQLKPVDCLDFEGLVHRINQVSFESPDLHQDYEVLGIELIGTREARRRYY